MFRSVIAVAAGADPAAGAVGGLLTDALGGAGWFDPYKGRRCPNEGDEHVTGALAGSQGPHNSARDRHYSPDRLPSTSQGNSPAGRFYLRTPLVRSLTAQMAQLALFSLSPKGKRDWGLWATLIVDHRVRQNGRETCLQRNTGELRDR
jgi:hypothetical protein